MRLLQVAVFDGTAVSFREPVVVSTAYERSGAITEARIVGGNLHRVGFRASSRNRDGYIGPLTLPVQRCEGCGVVMLLAVFHEYWRGTPHLGERRFCTAACRERARRARWRTPLVAVTCASCGSEFQPKRRDARTCSTRCRVALHRARAAHA